MTKRRLSIGTISALMLFIWLGVSYAQGRSSRTTKSRTLHSAETGNVNGIQEGTLGSHTVAAQVVAAGGWDGTLNFEGSTDGTNYIAVQCRDAATNNLVTTATADGIFACNLVGIQMFRARISGRTAGNVTVVAIFNSTGNSGVSSRLHEDSVTTFMFDDAADSPATGECIIVAADTTQVEYITCPGAAGGDSVSIDGDAGVVDPDFVSTGDIDFIDTTNTITANINANTVNQDELAATVTLSDGDLFDFGANVSTATEGVFLPSNATTCVSATEEGQVCWEEDADVLWIGDGAAAAQVGGAEINDLEATDPPNVADNEVYVGTGAAAGAWTALQNCVDGTESLDFDGTSFVCNAISSGGNSFETWNTDAGVNPVADIATDTVALTSAISMVITGANDPESATFDFDYSNELTAIDIGMAVDECLFRADTGGASGGFVCEGSTADANEQEYFFPDVNGADTTQEITINDATQALTNKTIDATNTVTINASDITDLNGSTDITADLEEETHGTEHDGTDADYMLDSGDTFTGEVTVDDLGIEFTPGDTLTNCTTFAATGGGIYYDDSEGVLKKCQDNVLTDLDTGGAESNDLEAVVGSVQTNEIFVGSGASAGAYIAIAACAADQKIEYTDGAPNTFTCEDISGLTDADVGDITLGTGTAGDFVGTITAGAGLSSTGATTGEDIDHTLSTASGETDFIASGALTCGAGTQGRAQVHTTPLQYCDNAATPALQYTAYGNSSGESTAAANNSVALTTDTTGGYAASTGEAGGATSLEADGLDAMTEIAVGIKRRGDDTDTHLLTTSAAIPGGNLCLELDTNGSVVAAAGTCASLGPGGTTTIDALGDAAGAGAVQVGTDQEYGQAWTWNTPATTVGALDGLSLVMELDATTDAQTQKVLVVERGNTVTGALTLESLVELNNNDADGAVTNAIAMTAAAGLITNAFNLNDAQITNAFVTPNATLTMAELEFLDGGTRTDEALCTYETTGNELVCDVNSEATLETALSSLDVVTVTAGDITTANLMTILSDEGASTTLLHGDGTWSQVADGDIADAAVDGGSGGEIADNTIDENDITLTLNMGGSTSLEIPNSAAPTVDAFGEIAGDDDKWGALRGAIAAYDGTGITHLVGIQSGETCLNNDIPKFVSGSGTWSCVPDSTGGGSLGSNLTSTTNDILSDVATTGAIVLGSNLGGGSQEALTFDFDTTDNEVAISSTTGVTDIKTGSINLTTHDLTVGDNAAASQTITGDVSGTDTVITLGNGVVNISTGALQEGGTDVIITTDTVVKSVYWGAGAMSVDGTQCADPTESANTLVKQFSIVCADSDDGDMYGSVVMPDGWNGGTVVFTLSIFQVAASTQTIEIDFAALCVSSDEALTAFGATPTGEQPASITLTADNDMLQDDTPAVTVDGTTCAGGDTLFWTGQVDATASGANIATAVEIMGVSMEYTWTQSGD